MDPRDCTVNPVPGLAVTKSVSPKSGTKVHEGDTLSYKLTLDNSTGRAAATVDWIDDLRKVLDDARVASAPVLATGRGLAVSAIRSGTFRITGSLAAGARATVTYQVRVNHPDHGDRRLLNFVRPTATASPSACNPGGRQCTDNIVIAGATPPSKPPTSPVAQTGLDLASYLGWAGGLIVIGLLVLLVTGRRRRD